MLDPVGPFTAARSPNDLFGLLTDAASDLGFDKVAYASLSDLRHLDAVPADMPTVMFNFPSDWAHHYMTKRYQFLDPVVLYTPVLLAPYLWDSLSQRFALTRAQLNVLCEASDAGLKQGVSIPLHEPWGRTAVVSFAASDENVEAACQLSALYVLTCQFHVAYAALRKTDSMEGRGAKLSTRELDCLAWVGRGKSSWDMSKILGISENTVNFHIKRAMKKLGTNNRTVAVVKALQNKLLEI